MNTVDYEELGRLVRERNGFEIRARQFNVELALKFPEFARMEASGQIEAAIRERRDRCRNPQQAYAFLKGDVEHEYHGPDRQQT